MDNKPTAYTLTLLFPNSIDKNKVTEVDYQVTGVPTIQPPLKPNQMPASFHPDDTLTFTYSAANPNVKINSCLLTQYNIDDSQKENSEDFVDQFDKVIPITPEFFGSWIFHLLGMYKLTTKDAVTGEKITTSAAYYLDPEFTCS